MTNPAGAQHPTLVFQSWMEKCPRNASSEDRSDPYKCGNVFRAGGHGRDNRNRLP